MMYKKLSLVAVICGFLVACFDDDNAVFLARNPAGTSIETIITGLSTPESVTVTPEGRLLVSNIGGAPGSSPNLGFISLNSTPVISGLDDPKGMGLLNQELAILSDHPNVKLININTNQVLFSLPINNAGFLNDVVALSETVALLSDTGTGHVYKIERANDNTLTASNFIDAAALNGNGVNGLLFRNSTLFLVTSTFGGNAQQGHLYKVELDSNFQMVGNVMMLSKNIIGNGNLDGIAANDRMLFISDWESASNPASIFAFDTEGMNLLHTISGSFSSPADIAIDRTGQIIYIPEFNNNRVSALNISNLK